MDPTFAEPRAAYIHVPFCAHRCGYCDFTLVARKDHLVDDYLRALERELKTLRTCRNVDTLFFGGGTPTYLSVSDLQRLITLVFTWLDLADEYEFSVEANPAGLTDEKIQVLSDAGVNRISLGVQSFDAPMLELLERDHGRADVVDTFNRLKQSFSNISVDLIFGVPGQTLELWRQTLRHAVQLEPQHISTYGLTYEKGTAFWSRRESGRLVAASDQLERAMYAASMDELKQAGFEQYEISNFARPRFRCQHNEVYWKGLPYFAFGPGAARYTNGRRETNHRSVTTWIRRVLAGQSGVGESEELSAEERARELIVLGLRRVEGVAKDEFAARSDWTLDSLVGDVIRKNTNAGLMEDTGSHVRLTREGRFFADTVVVDFL